MSTADRPGEAPSEVSREERMAALFANLVMQQTNMILMLLGRVPHPETGQTVRDLEGARMFVDQLEMIEFKTRGNLDAEEQHLLKQSLTAVRLTFVDAMEQQTRAAAAPPIAETVKPVEPTGTSTPVEGSTGTTEERRTKFSKSY